MDSKLEKMRLAAHKLISAVPAEESARMHAEIGRLLAHYDFSIDVEDIAVNNPVHILLAYLESYENREKSDRLEAQWFAALALYLIAHLQEHDADAAYFHFVWHALNTAIVRDERAGIIEYRTDTA